MRRFLGKQWFTIELHNELFGVVIKDQLEDITYGEKGKVGPHLRNLVSKNPLVLFSI